MAARAAHARCDTRDRSRQAAFPSAAGARWSSPGAKNPHEWYPFSTGAVFEGVISSDGHWKLHLPHRYQALEQAGADGAPGKYRTEQLPLSLFDMERDPHETTNVIAQYPEIAERLRGGAEQHRREFYPDQAAAA